MKLSTIATALALCLSTSASPVEERAFRNHPKTVTETVTHTRFKIKTKSVVSVQTETVTSVQTIVQTLPVSIVTATVLGSHAPKTVTSMSISISTLSACPSSQALSSTISNSLALPALTPTPSSTTSKTSTSSTTTSKAAQATPTVCSEFDNFPYPMLSKNYLDCGNSSARNSSYYYLQISGTGTNIDGTLLLSYMEGEAPDFFQPYNSTYTYTDPYRDGQCQYSYSHIGPYPFTWDRKNNALLDAWGGAFSTFYNSVGDGWIGTWWGNNYGTRLSCYVTGSDLQVNCNATDPQSHITYNQLYVDSSDYPNSLNIAQAGSSQKAVTLKLVSPCA